MLHDFIRVFRYFGDISSASTPILARKISFQREKICPTKWPKIQLDPAIKSKSQNFDHTWLRSWPQLLSKGILNVMTLWSIIRSCCIYFLPFLALKLVILLLFFNFFLFWHLLLSVNRDRTKYGINKCMYLSHICVWLMHIWISYIFIYIYERVYIYLLGFRFAISITL